MLLKKTILLSMLLGILPNINACELSTLPDQELTKQQLTKKIRSKYKKLSKIGKRIHEQQDLMDSFTSIRQKIRRKIWDKRLEETKKQNIKLKDDDILDEIGKEWSQFCDSFNYKVEYSQNTGQLMSTILTKGDIQIALLKFHGIREDYEIGLYIELIKQYEIIINEIIQLRKQLDELQ